MASLSIYQVKIFYVLVYSAFYLLVRLFQCSSQHNLCAHQRAGTPRGFYSLPRLFSKLDSCRAFNSFISLSLRLIVLGLSSDRVSALSDFRHRLAKFAKQGDQLQNIVLLFLGGILEWIIAYFIFLWMGDFSWQDKDQLLCGWFVKMAFATQVGKVCLTV